MSLIMLGTRFVFVVLFFLLLRVVFSSYYILRWAMLETELMCVNSTLMEMILTGRFFIFPRFLIFSFLSSLN